MSAEQTRNRTVGCKMTDSEYERLSAVAEGDGMTLGEWVREVLLERADGRKPSIIVICPQVLRTRSYDASFVPKPVLLRNHLPGWG